MEFKQQQEGLAPDRRLSVGIVYSYAPNADAPGETLADEAVDPSQLTADDRAFLDEAIRDYNAQFGTAYDTSAQGFEGYYEDISRRLAERTIDLVIVVNMFLTGFDSKTLNTLWVDKSLRTHGLIQAFSRTNRILNSVKTYGNVVCFRDLQEETDEAIALFGNEAAGGLVLLNPYKEYLEDYLEKINELRARFEPSQMIASEAEQKEFICQFGKILRLRNILASFDDFGDDDVIGEAEFQDYRSVYVDLYAEMRRAADVEKEVVNDDLVFEIELVKQVEVGVDYVLMLVEKHQGEAGDGEDKEIPVEIRRAVTSSPSLHNKRHLIEDSCTRCRPSGTWASSGGRSVSSGVARSWQRSSAMSGCARRRRRRWWRQLCGTGTCPPREPRSRGFCRPPPGSAARPATATTKRSAASKPPWPPMLSGSGG